MLLYKPPFLQVGDLTIFKDDKDPNTFYYAVINPSIILKEEVPAIAAYALIPESGFSEKREDVVAASLSLEVALTPTPGSLERATAAIKKAFQKEVKILAPAPVVEGKVYLSVASVEETTTKEEWFITNGVSPSIIGDNKVALNIKTTGENAKRLIAALHQGQIAGALYYDLRILGIAPVYNAKMKVKWDKVYHHFAEYKTTNYFFVKEEISNIIDNLKETSLIEITVEELDPDIKDFAVKNLFNELKSEVIKRLFKPTTPPLSSAKKWEDRIVNGVSRMLSSIIPGAHYQLLNLSETQLSETTINLSEKRAKKYPIYPQALLSTMIEQAGGMGNRLKWIQEADLPFRSELITITLAADTFESSNIKAVKLACKVIETATEEVVETATLIFNPAEKLTQHFRYTQQRSTEYTFKYKATIYLDTIAEVYALIPNRLELDWQDNPNEFIYFNPAEHFEPFNFTLAIDDIDLLNQAPIIEVQLALKEKTAATEAPQKSLIQKTFLFKKEAKESQPFSFVMPRTVSPSVNLKVIYYLPEAKDFELTIPDLTDDYFFIPNPFENKWTIDLISAVDWETTLKIIAEIRVWDVIRQAFIRKKITFTEQKDLETLQFITSLETPAQTCEIRYNVIKKDAMVTRSAWLPHQGAILVVKDQVKAERTLHATLKTAPNFEEIGLKKVYIKIKYKDAQNDINIQSNKLYFKEIGDIVSFTHPMPDLTALTYQYQVQAINTRGKRYKTKWLKSVSDTIDITIPENPW